jgi:uncharacterized protein (TIGR03083 family)
MTPPLDTLVEGLDATHRRVGVLLAELPADAWTRTVPATPAWSVADVVSHLAHGDQAALASVQGRLQQDPSSMPLDSWTAAGVALHAGEPTEARVAGWEAAADALRWHLAALDADGWRARVPWVLGPTTVRTVAQLRLQEAWVHGHDLAEAVGAGFEVDPTSLAWMADVAAKVIPGGLSRSGRPHPGAVIRVRLGEAGEWLLGGALGQRPAPDAAPDLTIEADPVAFVLRAAGRSGGQPWRAEGDQALAADVAATLSSVG